MSLFSEVLQITAVVQVLSGPAALRPTRPALPAADSVRLLRTVRSSQSAFESFRRSRLPVGPSRGGYCDVRIGRYCYWRGDEDEETQPEEPQAIRDRRKELIARLDTAAQAVPGDAWIVGQLVRYQIEAGKFDDALRSLGRCRASGGWCSALGGLTNHAAGRFEAADSAYRMALDSMPTDEQCRWLDIREIVDDELSNRLGSLECPARAALALRVLHMSAPLYSVSASDALTEHLARLTKAVIGEHSASVDGEVWGDDVRALVVRYGWPRWYTRTQPDFGSQRAPSVMGHDDGMPFNFVPSLHAVEHIGHVTDDDWKLDDDRAVTGYAPSYTKSVHDLSSQIATFRRGDSTLVVATWDARKDTTLLGRDLEAALVLATADSIRAIGRLTGQRTTGRISIAAPIDSGVASLELLAVKDRRAARRRVGVASRGGSTLALSDLLLYAPGGEAAYDLAAVRDSALATDDLSKAQRLGVYWELYGLDTLQAPVTFTLTIEQTQLSLLQRAAARAHLADPATELRVQWEEVPRREDGIAGRGISVDFSRLRSGHYHVELIATVVDHAPVTTSREITIR